MPKTEAQTSILEKSGLKYLFPDVATEKPVEPTPAARLPFNLFGLTLPDVLQMMAAAPADVGNQYIRFAMIAARVLEALRANPSMPFEFRKLVDLVGVDHAALSPVIDGLANAHVITVDVDKYGDRRVALSPAAVAVAATIG